jgi:Tfp pilus assembly protein PilN
LERLDLLKKDVETAHVELESCRGEARRAEDALNDLDRPWSFVVRFLVVAGTIVGTAVCVFAVGKLMAPSFDAYFVRSWAESLNLGDAAAGYSVREAKWISFSVAAGTMFLSTLGTLALRRARWWLKVLPLLAEALLSISFATIRLSHRLTFSAMAVSGLEMSVVLGQLAGLLLVAAALDHDSIKREPFTKALCKLTALMARVDVAREGHAEAERKLAEQVTALQRREDAVRALPAVKELVDATVAAEYVTAISNLVEHKAATRDEEATSIDPSAIPKTNGASANGVDHGEE